MLIFSAHFLCLKLGGGTNEKTEFWKEIIAIAVDGNIGPSEILQNKIRRELGENES